MANKDPNISYWKIDLKENYPINKSSLFSNKFKDDKLFYEDEQKILLIDGVLLNKKELFDYHQIDSMKQLLILVLKDINNAQSFIGPFSIFVYDKNKKYGFSLGNQTGDSSIFYTTNDTKIDSISNNFIQLSDYIHKRELDEQAAHYLITFGYIIGNHTIVKCIKRLMAGEYIYFSGNNYQIKRYHHFECYPKNNVTIDQACEQIDLLFRKAVRRCFEKDLEYGFKEHLVDISAGLDSRMTNWVAKELGYNNITNISYSQSNSEEEEITKKIINYLGNKFFYHPLDDVSFLFDIDKIVEKEFGMSYYCGITGGWDFLNIIDFSKFGLEHTGQIGDGIISSLLKKSCPVIDFNFKRNSNLLKLRYTNTKDFTSFNNLEEFALYTRLFQGALSTHYIRSNYTYSVSPFLDIELLNFCLKIPDELRYNHKLYWYWIDKKYPIAGKIPSSRLRNISQKNKLYSFYKRGTRVANRIGILLLAKAGLKKCPPPRSNMNPYTFWINSNKDLSLFIETQFDSNISLLSKYPLLKQEAKQMIESPIGLDKLMVISMLSAVKRFCN